MKFTKILLLIFLQGIALSSLYSQHKFGKISKEELEVQYYEKDSSAAAVILFDIGSSSFNTNSQNSFDLMYDRHIRILILDKEAYDAANISIPFYNDGDLKENISGLKAYSYNLSEDGKIEKTALEKSAIFEEQSSKYWKRMKFTMPKVKEGTIIEYRYRITSNYFSNLREWYFQSYYPIILSQYSVEIPEYFKYKQLQEGYAGYYDTEVNKSSKQFQVRYREKGAPASSLTSGSPGKITTSTINAIVEKFKWTAKDVPAFKEESYMTAAENHLSKIRFQLNSIQFPNQPIDYVSNSWPGIAKDLMKADYFGKRIKSDKATKTIIAEISDNYDSKKEKLNAIYEYFISAFKWNELKGIVADQSNAETLKTKSGSVAEINLLMLSVLKEAGFETYPVLLSTRNHGHVNMFYTSLSNFNYVIGLVNVDDELILLDATAKDYPMGVLPYHCLNKVGLLVNEEDTQWVNLSSLAQTRNQKVLQLKLHSNGMLDGNLVVSSSGYEGIAKRRTILNSSEEDYIKKYWSSDEDDGFKTSSHELNNLEDFKQPLRHNCKVELQPQQVGNMIYLEPILIKFFEENPFQLEKRTYPVSFGFTFQEFYSISISLPEGYTIEEVPENVMLYTSDKSSKFSYLIAKQGNIIQMRASLSVKKEEYAPEFYQELKEFFSRIIAKQEEKIVIKKT